MIAAFLTLVGFGYSAYLTYLELFVLDAICQWCVASAIIMTALLAVAITRVLIAPDDPPLRHDDARSRAGRVPTP